MKTKVEVIRYYFSLLESFNTDEIEFKKVLHQDFRQKELPNLLNKNGQESDRTDSIRRAALGKKILSQQKMVIENYFENGAQIVVETTWSGTLAIDVGNLKAKQSIKAYFCIVCEFKDGKIYRQRNYDCFEPF
jgi:hypothetical protein